MAGKKIGRYQEKQRRGLVPAQYDRTSRGFMLGAHRYWPSSDRTTAECRRQERIDREFLERARLAR